jgi:hypothetical protein
MSKLYSSSLNPKSKSAYVLSSIAEFRPVNKVSTNITGIKNCFKPPKPKVNGIELPRHPNTIKRFINTSNGGPRPMISSSQNKIDLERERERKRILDQNIKIKAKVFDDIFKKAASSSNNYLYSSSQNLIPQINQIHVPESRNLNRAWPQDMRTNSNGKIVTNDIRMRSEDINRSRPQLDNLRMLSQPAKQMIQPKRYFLRKKKEQTSIEELESLYLKIVNLNGKIGDRRKVIYI